MDVDYAYCPRTKEAISFYPQNFVMSFNQKQDVIEIGDT
jgi:hypothetical protein